MRPLAQSTLLACAFTLVFQQNIQEVDGQDWELGDCSSYQCPEGKTPIKNPPPCIDATCSVAECCEDEGVNVSTPCLGCPAGYEPRPGVTSCNKHVCFIEDCCREAECRDMYCTDGWTLVLPPVPCSSETCSRRVCCNPPPQAGPTALPPPSVPLPTKPPPKIPTCGMVNCREGFTLRMPLVSCEGDTCTQHRCCIGVPATCSLNICGREDGYTLKSPSPPCHGETCNKDTCCDKVMSSIFAPGSHPQPGPWKCHTFDIGQNDDWCVNVGEMDGWEYEFFGPEGSPCGSDCGCCKRAVDARAEANKCKPNDCWESGYSLLDDPPDCDPDDGCDQSTCCKLDTVNGEPQWTCTDTFCKSDGYVLRKPVQTCSSNTCSEEVCCMSVEAERAPGPWQCQPYDDGQDDDWCVSMGEQDGWEYELFGPESPCGGESCACCKRLIEGPPEEPSPSPGSPSSQAESGPGPWQCQPYLEGQDDDWCVSMGEQDGWEYELFGPASPCGGASCACCKRLIEGQAPELSTGPLPASETWSCVDYKPGQNDDWCVEVGAADGYEYELFGAGASSPCGGCACCKRPDGTREVCGREHCQGKHYKLKVPNRMCLASGCDHRTCCEKEKTRRWSACDAVVDCEDGYKVPMRSCVETECSESYCCEGVFSSVADILQQKAGCEAANCDFPGFVPKTPPPDCAGKDCDTETCCDKVWACHSYAADENDDWCVEVGVKGGYEYELFGASDSACGIGCRCCKRPDGSKAWRLSDAVGGLSLFTMPSTLPPADAAVAPASGSPAASPEDPSQGTAATQMVLSILVEGLDCAAVMAQPHVRSGFQAAVLHAVISSFSQLSERNTRSDIACGSVIAKVIINPQETSPMIRADDVRAAAQDVLTRVANELQKLPDLQALATSPLAVSTIDVEDGLPMNMPTWRTGFVAPVKSSSPSSSTRPALLSSTTSPSSASSSEAMDWQCHHYAEDQDDDWCVFAGVVGGYEYELFGPSTPPSCGGCWCCKRLVGQEAHPTCLAVQCPPGWGRKGSVPDFCSGAVCELEECCDQREEIHHINVPIFAGPEELRAEASGAGKTGIARTSAWDLYESPDAVVEHGVRRWSPRVLAAMASSGLVLVLLAFTATRSTRTERLVFVPEPGLLEASE